jgi:alginate O-acetyltransferase complex protein AlgI
MLFVIGLFKKVVLADGVAAYVAPGFEAARLGDVGFFDAWGAGLGFTMQIYFDFSGYSDMAIGLSRMFGVAIPINFNSPFQAFNITEFWQRWHITLTRFLGDYLFVPMGGRRRSAARRAFALLATMLLAGLWHGAGWTFIAFGGLHGSYLLIHHNWRTMRRKAGHKRTERSVWTAVWTWSLTSLAWTVGAVMFRADSLGTWWRMVQGMAGANGVVLPAYWREKLGTLGHVLDALGVAFGTVAAPESIKGLAWAIPLLLIAVLLPNSQRLMRAYLRGYRRADLAEPLAFRGLAFAPSRAWAVALGLCAAFALLRMTRISEFLYYQF